MLQYSLSVNQQLRDSHRALSYIASRRPGILGDGLLGLDDVHRVWRCYVAAWVGMGRPQVFMVKTDIANCYDSMDQGRLFTILEELLTQVKADTCSGKSRA